MSLITTNNKAKSILVCIGHCATISVVVPHEKVRHCQLSNEATTFNHFLRYTKMLH